jgi:hypothetical protein
MPPLSRIRRPAVLAAGVIVFIVAAALAARGHDDRSDERALDRSTEWRVLAEVKRGRSIFRDETFGD